MAFNWLWNVKRRLGDTSMLVVNTVMSGFRLGFVPFVIVFAYWAIPQSESPHILNLIFPVGGPIVDERKYLAEQAERAEYERRMRDKEEDEDRLF